MLQGKPGIPQVPHGLGTEAHRFMSTVKEHLEVAHGVRGDYNNRYVTLGILVKLGLITQQQADNVGGL